MLGRLALLASFAVAANARGQVPDPLVPPIAAESLPVFERPNGALLRPGTLTYALTLSRRDGQLSSLGTRTVTVSEAALGSGPGWLIDEARRGTAVETSDSLYVARADLSPQRWTATIGRAQLGASFTRDSIFGAMDTYRGRSSFTAALPPGALLSAGMVERIVELLPLRMGYRASAHLLMLGSDGARVVPAEILVDRDERMSIGPRSLDCWVVALRAGTLEQRLWVAKDDSRVVRTEQSVPDGTLTATLLP